MKTLVSCNLQTPKQLLPLTSKFVLHEHIVLFVAMKLEPTNVNILWDRAALCYQMDNPKKALECYEMARQVINLSLKGFILKQHTYGKGI